MQKLFELQPDLTFSRRYNLFFVQLIGVVLVLIELFCCPFFFVRLILVLLGISVVHLSLMFGCYFTLVAHVRSSSSIFTRVRLNSVLPCSLTVQLVHSACSSSSSSSLFTRVRFFCLLLFVLVRSVRYSLVHSVDSLVLIVRWIRSCTLI